MCIIRPKESDGKCPAGIRSQPALIAEPGFGPVMQADTLLSQVCHIAIRPATGTLKESSR
jgi:hypothetical protein